MKFLLSQIIFNKSILFNNWWSELSRTCPSDCIYVTVSLSTHLSYKGPRKPDQNIILYNTSAMRD
jgi:hypothetical protein